MKFPIAIDQYFLGRSAQEESAIREEITAYRAQRIPEWEAAMFEQRKRNADAQRLLAKKPTKKGAEDFRISEKKVDQLMRWLDEFKQNVNRESDTVVHSMNYAPVIVQTDG